MLTEGLDEDAPSLLLGHDDEGRIVVSVMSDGEGGAIRLTGEQVEALKDALDEVWRRSAT
jgi:hypothetical protein